MASSALLFLFCLVFAFTAAHLLRKDLFFAGAYFYLFVYGIFALVGYLYFPELSMLIRAYFGPQIEQTVLIFLILSFTAVYLGLLLCSSSTIQPVLVVDRLRMPRQIASGALIFVGGTFLITGYVSFASDLSYLNVSDDQFFREGSIYYKVWITSFKELPVLLTVLYAALRYDLWPDGVARAMLALWCLVFFALFVVISYGVKNRTDAISLFNAFVFIEIICRASAKQNGREGTPVWALAFVGLALVAYLSWLAGTRSPDPNPEGLGIAQVIIAQDYFAPAHILFAAVAKDIVNPLEVMASNTANAMVLMDHPYLQQTVAETFNPGVSSRNSSYAFYLLSEGYLAMGPWGFLYNGLIVTLGYYLWRRLAVTTSPVMNALLLPVIALDLTNFARGQSAYFVKCLYFHYIPALILIFVTTGFYVRGIRLVARRP